MPPTPPIPAPLRRRPLLLTSRPGGPTVWSVLRWVVVFLILRELLRHGGKWGGHVFRGLGKAAQWGGRQVKSLLTEPETAAPATTSGASRSCPPLFPEPGPPPLPPEPDSQPPATQTELPSEAPAPWNAGTSRFSYPPPGPRSAPSFISPPAAPAPPNPPQPGPPRS